MANITEKIDERQENIAQTVSSTTKFFEDNKKCIIATVAAVVVIGLGVLAYNKFIYQRQVAEATEQAFPAETLFQNGEYELALNGDGNNLGFADIIAQYGSKAGKAMPFYAGVCELQLGNFESALSYLAKYKGKEPILAARAKACQGDAYVGLGDYKAAVASYKAAVATADNMFAAAYLLKQGIALEALEQKAEAKACYESIKDKYPQSIEAYEIDKYIARVAE